MSTAKTVFAIIAASPRPGNGYHEELHVEPYVKQKLMDEALNVVHKNLETPRPSGFYFCGIPIVVDPGVTYAEVHIVPNRPKKQGIFDKAEAWLEEHGL